MKFYIATSTERMTQHNHVRDALQSLGYTLTYDWTSHGSVRHTSKVRLQEVAHLETQGILEADFVIVLLPGGKGTHVELGLSIGSKKKVFIHCEDPGMFELGTQVCAFYHHPDAVRFACPIEDVAKIVQSLLDPALI